MPTIYVTSAQAGTGKTGVAAAIARHYAYLGVPTKLIRFSGAGRAENDAVFFASQAFVPGSQATPLDPAAFTAPAARDLAVIEGEPGDAPADAQVVLVGRGSVPSVPADLKPAAIVVTNVTTGETLPDSAGDVPVVGIASDRVLAGFAIDDLRRLLNPEVLVEGDPIDSTCDHLVIAPIGSDAGQPYFRRFERPCVVVRYDKTDQHLAALRGDPVCLVLTGGRRPSDYTIDAGLAKGVPVFLSRTDTENTIILLETLFDDTRFEGEAKMDRMSELLEQTNLFDPLDIEVAVSA